MSFTISPIAAEQWRMPPDEPIHEWAARNVTFGSWSPYEGRFNPELMPWLIRPLETLRRDDIWRMLVVAAAAGGKSTLAELFLSWLIDRAPGPVAWNSPTEEDAKEFSETRITRFLESCPAVAKWFPSNRHHKRTNAILFPHMSLIIQAANEGNAQMKHLRYLLNDETWLWKAGILTQMHKRTTRFAHNRKVVDLSTGSLDGDETDQGWKDGTREEWQFRCEACHGHHVPLFTFGSQDAPGGVKWHKDARRKDGSWDYKTVIGSAQYQCPHCSRLYDPTDANAVLLNRHGCYSPESSESSPGVASFSWSALVSDFRILPQIAVEFLQAKEAVKRGTTELLREVTQKRFAKAWKEDAHVEVKVEKEGGYLMADPWPEEAGRFFTVDCQTDHFWGVVRAWSVAGESRLKWAGRMETWEDVRKVQEANAVPDGNVAVDSGGNNDMTQECYTKCCYYGWNTFKGRGQEDSFRVAEEDGNTFAGPIKESDENIVPNYLEPGSKLSVVSFFLVSYKATAQTLQMFRTAKHAKWSIAKDAPEAYRKQMNSIMPKTFLEPKTGRPFTKFVVIGRSGCHSWDCERYQNACAWRAGVIGAVQEQPKA